jgi:hypothetical protein
MISARRPRVARCLGAAANALFVVAVAGALVYAFLHGMDRQEQINEQTAPDQCRLPSSACYAPPHG